MQIPQITFLRFIAAISVVIYHAGLFTPPINSPWLLPIFQQGSLGVGFFFTLSGFLMAWVYGRQDQLDLKAYARSRFARIAPLYWLAFGLTLFCWMVLRDLRPRGLSIILQSLGLHAWVPDYSITLNYPGWTVSVEVFLYLMFPPLLRLLKGRSMTFLLIFSATFWALGLLQFETTNDWSTGWFHDPNGDFLLRFPPWHLNAFIVGLCGGLFYAKYPKRWEKQPWLPTALILLSAIFLIGICFVENPILSRSANGLLSPVFLLIIIALAQDRGPVSYLFSLPFLVFLGESSYAIYLLQCPVYLLMDYFVPDGGLPGIHGIWFWAYLGALIPISALVYTAFERPLRAKISRKKLG